MILFLAWQYRPPISYKSLFGFKTKSLNQIKNVQKTKYDLMVLYMLRPILPCHKQESTAWSTMRMWPTNDNVASTQKLHYHININLTLYSYHNVILATPFNVNMEVALYKEGDTIGVGTFTSHFSQNHVGGKISKVWYLFVGRWDFLSLWWLMGCTFNFCLYNGTTNMKVDLFLIPHLQPFRCRKCLCAPSRPWHYKETCPLQLSVATWSLPKNV